MSFDTVNPLLEGLEPYKGKFFLGIVRDNNDPKNLGRIRAEVPGLWRTDPAHMPWCGQVKFSSMGQGDGTGTFGSPPVDSDVLILLQDGNPHYPLYFSVQTTANSNFPVGSWGWTDQFGNTFKVDKDGMSLSTACGALIKIDKDCKATMTFPGGLEINADVTINGKTNHNGDVNISGKLDVTGNITSGGNVTATGDVKAAGGSKSLTGHWHAVLAKDFGITSPPL